VTEARSVGLSVGQEKGGGLLFVSFLYMLCIHIFHRINNVNPSILSVSKAYSVNFHRLRWIRNLLLWYKLIRVSQIRNPWMSAMRYRETMLLECLR
jgi:hypothetical protein